MGPISVTTATNRSVRSIPVTVIGCVMMRKEKMSASNTQNEVSTRHPSIALEITPQSESTRLFLPDLS